MAVKYSFQMSDEQIGLAMAAIKKRSASLRADVHRVAVSILHNWAQSGAANVATRRATELLANVDQAHAQKVVNWFGSFAGLTYDKEEKAFRYTETTLSAENFQAAKAKSMYDLTKDAAPQPFDLDKRIADLIALAEKRAVKPREGDSINRDRLAKLRELIAA